MRLLVWLDALNTLRANWLGWQAEHLVLSTVLLVVAVLALTWAVRWVLVRTYLRAIRRLEQTDHTRLTRLRFLKHLLSFVVWVIGLAAAFSLVPGFDGIGTSLLAGAGVLAAIIGFASQAAFGNLVSGVFIVLYRPYRIGDLVAVSGLEGIVEDITLNHTVVRDFENRRIVVPNSTMGGSVLVNSSVVDERIHAIIRVPLAPVADVATAMAILHRLAEAHPLRIDARTPEELAAQEPAFRVLVHALTPGQIELRVRAWAANAGDAYQLRTDLLRDAVTALQQAGVPLAIEPYGNR